MPEQVPPPSVSLEEAQAWLRIACANPVVTFRPGQWEAIDRLVNQRRRALVVQRTGWGKSMVYFLAARFFRQQGAGPTVIVSPLLALMRNQIEAAARLGLQPTTINSSNQAEWHAVKKRLFADQVDLLLISPERLANDGFVEDVLIPISERISLLVVDEAHCISDWGHDFRPDYRRIVRVLRYLPQNVPVLATTATANSRVLADVQAQIGEGLETERGPLVRESLRLQTLRFPSSAERLAWLADHVLELPGSGIIYALTVRDSELVARWLQQRGVRAAAYHASVTSDDGRSVHEYREHLEQQLLASEVKCLVATTALGMGFDKPDLGFVIHYQAPGSVILYYQQVGRAGRAIPEAFGVLLSGQEDDEINEHFRESAFPPDWQVDKILQVLADSENGLTIPELETTENLRRGQIERVLRILAVQDRAPVARAGSKWFRTPQPYEKDVERMDRLLHQREQEWAQMNDYMEGSTCHMEFLARALDDPAASACGRCEVCEGAPALPPTYREETLLEALRFLRQSEMLLEPRKLRPKDAFQKYGWRGTIKPTLQAEVGRVLARWGEPGWGHAVREGKESGAFADALAAGAAEMVLKRWKPRVTWVTCVPSLRHPALVPEFAEKLAHHLGLPFLSVVKKVKETEPQKRMQNSFHQCRNLDGVFAISAEGADISGPVLLVDDVSDSGWTMTIIAALLRQAGCASIFPLALAGTSAG